MNGKSVWLTGGTTEGSGLGSHQGVPGTSMVPPWVMDPCEGGGKGVTDLDLVNISDDDGGGGYTLGCAMILAWSDCWLEGGICWLDGGSWPASSL